MNQFYFCLFFFAIWIGWIFIFCYTHNNNNNTNTNKSKNDNNEQKSQNKNKNHHVTNERWEQSISFDTYLALEDMLQIIRQYTVISNINDMKDENKNKNKNKNKNVTILYISLEERTDRHEQIKETYQKMIEFGHHNNKIKWLHANKRKPGALGCLLSHLQALCYVYDTQEYVMIMEDDIELYEKPNIWKDAWNELEMEWPNQTWDVLIWAPCVHSWSSIVKNGQSLQRWKRVWHSTSGGAYMVHPRYVKKLLERYLMLLEQVRKKTEFEHMDHFDQVQVEFQKTDIWLTPSTIMMGQRSGKSDLTNRTDHNKWTISEDGTKWTNGDGISGTLHQLEPVDWYDCHH
jgi:uncharacterized Zn finger protein (UPF0148 family)